jgi:hypothetical protein
MEIQVVFPRIGILDSMLALAPVDEAGVFQNSGPALIERRYRPVVPSRVTLR